MKKSFINWCRNCHFDWFIAVKESKGKRWMAVLSKIQIEGDFHCDDFNCVEDSWKQILLTINKMSDQQIEELKNLRYN